ncbi:MAG: hypothetical protein ABMB14_26675 [Myxococcota bacterium]
MPERRERSDVPRGLVFAVSNDPFGPLLDVVALGYAVTGVTRAAVVLEAPGV